MFPEQWGVTGYPRERHLEPGCEKEPRMRSSWQLHVTLGKALGFTSFPLSKRQCSAWWLGYWRLLPESLLESSWLSDTCDFFLSPSLSLYQVFLNSSFSCYSSNPFHSSVYSSKWSCLVRYKNLFFFFLAIPILPKTSLGGGFIHKFPECSQPWYHSGTLSLSLLASDFSTPWVVDEIPALSFYQFT